jgi:hypothetical protein
LLGSSLFTIFLLGTSLGALLILVGLSLLELLLRCLDA